MLNQCLIFTITTMMILNRNFAGILWLLIPYFLLLQLLCLASAFVVPTTIQPAATTIIGRRSIASSSSLPSLHEGVVPTQILMRRYATNDDDETWMDEQNPNNVDSGRRDVLYNTIALGLIGASGVASLSLFNTNVYTPSGFQRIPTQFIAALGDPNAKAGSGASEWGLWRLDPGPRGVWLRDYPNELQSKNNLAPAGWNFDPNDWWLEEHGLIMEAPKFPLQEGRYLVTGGRMVTTGLTIDKAGNWKLDDGTLYDVTHLPCRSARYTPMSSTENGSPLTANPKDFPVTPGAIMPSVPGCNKQDYAVLFVVGKAV